MIRLLAGATSLASVVVATPALADVDAGYGYGRWGGHMWGYGMMMGGGVVVMLLMVALIVAVIVLVWKAVAGHGPAPGQHTAHDAALSALRERFARGEIDEAEYQARKKVLES